MQVLMAPPPHVEGTSLLGYAADEPLQVGILLCTYNGGQYLREQLESFITQTYTHWRLYVSDDGSTDQTKAILSHYAERLGERMVVFEGPRQGFAQNFMSLIRNAHVRCHAYAFSDQDDIWLGDKLQRSVEVLRRTPADQPALYCSRTRLIDTRGKTIGFTPVFKKQPSFRNALVQSLAGANTMMINESARALLSLTTNDDPVVAHDWLTYLVVSGCGGAVTYDPIPTLLYRQHEGNLIGANTGLGSRVNRLVKMLEGRFKTWNEKNLRVMERYYPVMTLESRQLLTQFKQLRGKGLRTRMAALQKAGFYRQTLAGTLSLYVAVILKQV
jgi:glycosyltransferase involved in cell wall biosynthesis